YPEESGPFRGDYRDCPKGTPRCKPWLPKTKARAAEYALEWTDEDGEANTEDYWYFGNNNCTNFVSQAWFAAGQNAMYENLPRKNWPLNWWAERDRETPYEGANNNYNWTNVQGFRDQQVKSRRAIVLTEAKTRGKNLKVGDVVVIDFGDDEVWNHSYIVTQSNEDGRFVSSQTTTRHNFPWEELATEILPRSAQFGSETGEWEKNAWDWQIVRPLYKGSNVRR
ncbi:MAG TPA: amidase domain-containing protein, partial [Solirubrobacterales bacterium]|nr:amidase domain-containing protein [Solirubrobacterales bacterium]